MRNVNKTVLSAADNQTTNGDQIDANQLVSASFQAYFGDTNAAGTLKLQASNDLYQDRYQASNFTVTNWVDIPNQVATITTGTSALLTIAQSSYRWLRAVFTATGTGAQTAAPIADTSRRQAQTVTTIADTGAKEVTDIACVADVAGSLNSTYWTFFTASNAIKYYVWYNVDSAGVNPNVPAATGIEVALTAGDSATDVASATLSAIDGSGAAVGTTILTNHVGLTNNLTGVTTDASNGAASPGFTIGVTTQGAASNLNSKYFTLSSVNTGTKAQKNFYLWLNVNSQGVDPAPASKTAIPVAVAAGATANAVATAIRAALNALTGDFVATGATSAVIITNVAFGPVTAAADGVATTGFTFGSATVGIASNLNNKYFYLNSANSGTAYAIWMNVDGIGTAPVIAGRTSTAVAFDSASSAGTIGTALAAAVDALANFAASGTTTVTITNSASGPFTPITDAGSTGFTFAVTAGGSSTITVNMNALSV